MAKEPGKAELTFEALGRASGQDLEPPPSDGEFPVPAWYRQIYTTRLRDFAIEDVCRACRQRIYPEHMVPIACAHLEKDPLAGEMYDGELADALCSLDVGFWVAHPDLRDRVRILGETASPKVPPEGRRYLEELLERLTRSGVEV